MTIRGQLQILIVLRLVLVSLVSAAALSTSLFGGSTAEFLRLFLLVVYVLSGIYFLFLSYTNKPDELYSLQFFSDLVLVSLLIFSSGGTASPFSPLYVLIIVYASLFRFRKGAIIAVTLSIISYVGIAHLEYMHEIPNQVSAPLYSQVIYRTLWNILGFVAVAVLGSYLSERLVKTKQELGAVKMLHDNIVNSIRSGLITLDLQGRVTSLNRAAAEIFSQIELLNQPLSNILPAYILDSIFKTNFQPTSRPLRAECWLSHGENREVFVGMSCSPLCARTGQQIGYILSCQDLTEIKKREQELQIKEKMAAIGQVAAGLAHEIRNPLAALSGSIQILRSELVLKAEQERLIEIVLRECTRLNQTVADFLTYAGPPPPRFQCVDLVPLIRETVSLFSKSPEVGKAHSLQISPTPKDAFCLADPDQLRQAIWNIVQNAVRATPNGGTIQIRIVTNSLEVRVSIADHGIGMSEEEKEKIFQPFHTAFRKGVGLGMAIVYQIIQQHNGRIEIDSQPNRGTVVTLSFPGIERATSASVGPAELARSAVSKGA